MSRNAQVTSNDVTGDRSIPCPAFAPGDPCRFGVQISGSDAKLTGNRFTALDVGIDILQPARAFEIRGNSFRGVTQEVRGTAAP